MAKRKRKRGTSAQSAAALRRNGLKAFNQHDYTKAIAVWTRAQQKQAAPQTAVALAEAHFRRGIGKLNQDPPDLEAALADVERATQLQPEDACYTYHQALMLHRQGRVAEALPRYRQLYRQENEFAHRAAYSLALALAEQGEDPREHAVWAALSSREQRMLHCGLSPEQPPADDLPPFWQGILALYNGRYAAAQSLLQQTLSAPDNPLQQAAAHYALGLVAGHNEDWRAARHHWQAAYNSGFYTPQLQSNLCELYHRLAEEKLHAEDLHAALNAAREAAGLYEKRPPSLTDLEMQIYEQQGFHAANDAQWEEALTHWQKARDLDGGNFRVAYNSALALEKQDRFFDAAEAWREALRRRPRRSDHPDALTDEQVSRLWQRAATAYQKAGAYDDAIQVFRHAVKWQENNLELRLALAESLLTNGQLQAAENELDRILEKDPKYVPALIQLGEVLTGYGDMFRSHQAIRVWEQALEIDPKNQQVRHLLSDFYTDQAEGALQWAEVGTAIRSYEQALQYLPQEPTILAALGSCYLFLDDRESADKYITEAVTRAPADLRVYEPVLKAWLELEAPEEAERVLAQAETAVSHIPYQFYMSVGTHCVQYGLHEIAQPWLERVVATAPPSENPLFFIGEMLMFIGDPDMSRDYLERAIAADQEPGEAYLTLGILAIRQGDPELAEKHWKKAKRVARQQKDNELLQRIQEAEDMFMGPLGMLFKMFGSGGVPNLLELADMLGDDIDDVWDNDEEWDLDEFF